MKTYSFIEYSVLYIKSLRLVDIYSSLPLLLMLLLFMELMTWLLEWLLIFGVCLAVYKILYTMVSYIAQEFRSNRGGGYVIV